jgi:hypothetical protein
MGSNSGLLSPQPDIAGKPESRQTTIFHVTHENYSLAANGRSTSCVTLCARASRAAADEFLSYAA